MWKRRRTWLVLAALSCVALAVYFEPTRCVRGWLWGEAFFDGRPTSWWRGQIESDFEGGPASPWRSFWDELFDRNIRHHQASLPLSGDNRAKEVLRDLAEDSDTRVAEFAKYFLNEIENGEQDQRSVARYGRWAYILKKAGR